MATGTTTGAARRRRVTRGCIGAGLTGAVMLSACGDGNGASSGSSTKATSVVTAPPQASAAPTMESAPTAATERASETTSVVTAPASERVDLDEPTFTDPTAVTNPRFPIAALDQVIQLGEEAGASLRMEVTLLPETKVIEWDGQQIETLMSQFVAYEDGEVLEVAVDFFAQADDGSVWYFGEDVVNYVDGVVDNTEGTWLAGKDGPAGMIMPADPEFGDVYRPENIPGFVFEEVTVKAVDQTVQGPTGPVEGAVVVQELLMDGLLEDKTFAPGYGEFSFAVEAEDEVVEMALAVPTDVLQGDLPEELTTLSSGVDGIAAAVDDEDWQAAAAALDPMTTAWQTYRDGDVPPLLASQLTAALDVLTAAVDSRDAAAASAAAIDVGHATLDLHLQFRPPAEVDEERLDLWSWQLEVDEAARDEALAAGDRVVIDTIRQRLGQA